VFSAASDVRYTAAVREREAGLTLIELMVTLAVVAILAAIALPTFFGETRKARAAAEVQPMFNDLRVRLEEYLQEKGVYPPTIGEGTMHPVPLAPPARPPWDLTPLPTEWQDLKVRISGPDQVWCSYTWATGLANASANIGTQAKAFGFTAPTSNWYYLLAKCDMDADRTSYSYYFTSSVDPTIQKSNEGQ
jgi:prepilin-type N-terminal cleavage/methylation domain-containing protein